MKNLLLAAAAFAVACVVAGFVVLNRQSERQGAPPSALAPDSSAPTRTPEHSLPAPPPEVTPPTAATPASPASTPEAAPSAGPAQTAATPQNAAAPPRQSGRAPREPLHDPMAREALTWVGLEPSAEAYWHAAINDPNLPARERQDLIEDLNEDGLSDPRYPSPDDLPLILSRIELIQAVGPYAMDKVNADAFQEAYKDLVNLAAVALGGGEPVR